MIKIFVGDISKPKTEAIVNPSNKYGLMSRGISLVLSDYAGKVIEREAKELIKKNNSPFEIGKFYITGSSRLKRRGIKKIYHAVISDFPGGLVSLDAISKSMKSILEFAKNDDINSIAFPALGSGLGELPKEIIIPLMADILLSYNNILDISVVDANEDFVEQFKKRVNG